MKNKNLFMLKGGVLSMALAVAAGANAQNLLSNASFEAPVVTTGTIFVAGETIGSGWTVTNTSNTGEVVLETNLALGSIAVPTPYGSQDVVFAGTNFGVTQSVSLQAGKTYDFSFAQSAYESPYDGTGDVYYDINNGSSVFGGAVFSTVNDRSTLWTTVSTSFVAATSGTYTVSFTGDDIHPAVLDNVSLTAAAVPEPSSLVGFSLCGIGLMIRLRRKK